MKDNNNRAPRATPGEVAVELMLTVIGLLVLGLLAFGEGWQ